MNLRLPRKTFLKLLSLAVLSSPFWGLGHALWEVDDARYAEVPREMAETGDWLTPHLNYMDYIEKPPLIYWLGAASYKLFGVSEGAARIPHALLAALGLLITAWLGTWLFSPKIGIYAMFVLGTCLQYFVCSHILIPDMALSVCLLGATALILRCLKFPQDARWAAPLAWGAMALAFLSKGLIALLLPCLWIGSIWILFPELRARLKGLFSVAGIALFLILVLPWIIAMEMIHGDFFQVFFVEQHFLRYLTPRYNRPGPWYYFFGVEILGSLPWTPILFGAMAWLFLRWRSCELWHKCLGLWVLIVLVFFSLSKSKLITYILPLFAHQSLLAADLLSRLENFSKAAQWVRRIAAFLASVLFLTFASALTLLYSGKIPMQFEIPAQAYYGAAVTLLLIGTSLVVLSKKSSLLRNVPNPILVTLLTLGANLSLVWGSYAITDLFSAKSLSQEIVSRKKPQDHIYTYNIYLHGIPFYTKSPVHVVIHWIGELHYAKRKPVYQNRFGNDDAIRALPSPGRKTFVVLENKELPYFISLNPPSDLRRLKAFGKWTVAEF